MQGLGLYLQELRKVRGLSKNRLAQRAGISHSTLGTWEVGTHLPRLPELEAVLTTLGATASQKRRALALMDTTRAARQLRMELTPRTEDLGRMPSGGDMLRAMRMRKGWTQEQVASKLGVQQSTVARWEKGEVWPETQALHTLCLTLEAQEDEVFLLTCGFFSMRQAACIGRVLPEEVEYGFWTYETAPYSPDAQYRADMRLLTLQAQAWPLAARSPSLRPLYAQICARYAITLADRARYTEAMAQAYRALEAAPETQKDWKCHAIFALANALVYRGNRLSPERGIRLLHDWLPQMHSPAYYAWGLSLMAKFVAFQGDLETALAQMQEACESARQSNNELEWRLRTLDQAEMLLKAGRPQAALSLLPEDMEEMPPGRVREMLLRAEALRGLDARAEAYHWMQSALELIAAHNLTQYKRQAEILSLWF